MEHGVSDFLDTSENYEDEFSDISLDEWDGMLITEWFQADPGAPIPTSSRFGEYQYAHENPDAWDFVDDSITGLSTLEAIKVLRRKLSPESRAIRVSTVDRSVRLGTDSCEACRTNTDPKRIPIHPNCTCNIATDGVETGVVDADHPFFSTMRTAAEDILMIGEDVTLPDGIQLDPASTAILDMENLRFGDLARWLEQTQPYIDAGAQYVSIVIDEDTGEAAEEVVSVIEEVAAGTQGVAEGLQNRKMWLSIAKAVVL
jgi:hypothetical protein